MRMALSIILLVTLGLNIQAQVANHQDTTVTEYHIYASTFLLKIPIATIHYSLTTDTLDYKISAQINSDNFGKRLYDINALFTSKGHKEGWQTSQYVRRSTKDGYEVFDSVAFDSKNKVAYEEVQNSESIRRQYVIALTDTATHDLLSALGYISSFDFKALENKNDTITVLHNRKLLKFEVAYQQKEEKKFKNIGKIKTHKLELKPLPNTKPTFSKNISIWFSDDQDQQPLLISFPVKGIGKVQILFSHKH